MNERKLEFFAEVIGREVASRKQREKHRLANDLSRESAEAIAAAESAMASRVAAAKREIIRETHKRLSAETRRARGEYVSKRDVFFAEVIAAVTEDLQDFASSDMYENWLDEQISRAKAKHDFAVIIKLRPEDMPFAEKIREASDLAPIPGETDYIGGFILENETGNIQANYTFKSRLDEVIK